MRLVKCTPPSTKQHSCSTRAKTVQLGDVMHTVAKTYFEHEASTNREFKTFLSDVDAEYRDLHYRPEVRLAKSRFSY